MAEEIKKVVSVDVSKAVEDIKSLSDELEGMDDDILSSIKTFKDYKTTIEHLSVSLSKMDEDTDEYEHTLSDLNKVQSAYNDAISVSKTKSDAAAGSYNALSKEMSELKKAFKATNDETERSALAEKINGINDQLKSMDASIGNYQRNVGNYASAFTGGLEQIGEKFEALNNPMALVKTGIGGINKAFKALIANPIGAVIAAVVVAVKALVSAFKSNEEASNKLKVAFSKLEPIINGFKTVMGKIVNVIGDVIVWISKLAGNVLSSWSKIGGVLKTVLTVFNPVVDGIKKGFSILSDAVEGFVNLYTSVIDGVAKGSVKIAEWLNKIGVVSDAKLKQMQDVVNAEKTMFDVSTEYTERQIALEERRRKEEEETARKESEISKLKFQAVQTDKYSSEERQKFLQKAIDLEKEINQERLAIAKEELDIAEWKAAQAPNSKEDNENLAKVRANYYRVEKEFTEKSKDIYSQLVSAQNSVKDSSDSMSDSLKKANEIIEQSFDDINTYLEEQDKVFLDEQNKKDEKIKAIQNRLFEESLTPEQLQLQELDAQYKEELALYEEYGYSTLELTKSYEQKRADIIKNINDQIASDKEETRQTEINNQIAEIEKLAEKREEYSQLASDISSILGSIGDGWNSLLDQQYKTGKLSEKEYKRRQKALQAFQIASIVGQSAASIFDLWSGYASETSKINTQTAAATGPAAAATKATLDGKSLISTIAKTAAIASTAATQIAAIKSSSSSSSVSSGSSGSSVASVSSGVSSYTPSYSQTVMGKTDIQSLQNAVSEGTTEGQQNVKVYVLESDITTAQNDVKVRVEESNF